MRYIIGIITLLWTCSSCSEPAETNVSAYDEAEMGIEQITDVYMIHSDSAKVKFTISSPLLRKYKDGNIHVEEFIDGFELISYGAKMEKVSSIEAKYAQRRSTDGLLILRDSVIYTNERKDILETNALTINELAGGISSTKFFRLVRHIEGDTIYGRGFTANGDFSRLEVQKYIGKRQGIDLQLRP